jgi:hypothetical protein
MGIITYFPKKFKRNLQNNLPFRERSDLFTFPSGEGGRRQPDG